MNGQAYPTGTILTRREPEGDEYDRVIVSGHVAAVDNPLKAEWASQSGEGVVVSPADEFGGPKDVPSAELNGVYAVESRPPEEPEPAPKTEPLRTAEQQFADEAREATKSGQPPAPPSSPAPEDAVAPPPVEEEGSDPDEILDALGGRQLTDEEIAAREAAGHESA